MALMASHFPMGYGISDTKTVEILRVDLLVSDATQTLLGKEPFSLGMVKISPGLKR